MAVTKTSISFFSVIISLHPFVLPHRRILGENSLGQFSISQERRPPPNSEENLSLPLKRFYKCKKYPSLCSCYFTQESIETSSVLRFSPSTSKHPGPPSPPVNEAAAAATEWRSLVAIRTLWFQME